MTSFKTCLLILVTALTMLYGCITEEDFVIKDPGTIHPLLAELPLPQGWGVNIHFYNGNTSDLTMLKHAGIGMVRMDVSWAGIEKETGIYDFSQHDQLIADLQSRDIGLLFIIDYGNPLYDQGMAPHSVEGIAAYQQFCAALAQRYADKGIFWELWNEPNLDHFWTPRGDVDAYMKWCKAVAPVIRENDPNAVIIAPATSSFDIPFMEACFKQGLLELVDGISVHPYRNAWLSPETSWDEYRALDIMIEQYRPEEKSIPILSGEWGYSTTYLSPEKQGKYLARQWLSNTAAGIPVSIWYDWHDDGQDKENAEHNFGTVTWDYQPKPAYRAMQTLTSQLNGFSSSGRISLGNADDNLMVFLKGNQAKLAVWTTGDAHQVDLGEGLSFTDGVAQNGAPIIERDPRNILVSDEPAYFTAADPCPAWLDLIIRTESLNNEAAADIISSVIQGEGKTEAAARIQNAIRGNDGLDRRVAFHVLLNLSSKLTTDMGLQCYHWILQRETDELNLKRMLHILAKIGAPQSMPFVTPLLKNPHLVQAISDYYLNRSFNLAKARRFSESETLLREAAKISRFPDSIERVVSLMRGNGYQINSEVQSEISQSAGLINRWWIAGPFPNPVDAAANNAYFPEKEIIFTQSQTFDTLTARWQQINLPGISAVLPFAKMFGRVRQTAYAYAEIHMDSARKGMLKMGSNDGVVCWLNDKKVHQNLIPRAMTVDEDIVMVNFKKGRNTLLLKILNDGANWEACLRICDMDGVLLNLNGAITVPATVPGTGK